MRYVCDVLYAVCMSVSAVLCVDVLSRGGI